MDLLWFFFCLVFAMPLCSSVYMCLVATCWERADLLALVCGVQLLVCHFPIGILSQVRYLIVSIPDLYTLTYFCVTLSRYIDAKEPIGSKLLFLSPICSRKGAYPLKTSLAIDSDSEVSKIISSINYMKKMAMQRKNRKAIRQKSNSHKFVDDADFL